MTDQLSDSALVAKWTDAAHANEARYPRPDEPSSIGVPADELLRLCDLAAIATEMKLITSHDERAYLAAMTTTGELYAAHWREGMGAVLEKPEGEDE